MASPLQSFPVPSSRFQHLHVDIVGPLPPSRGCSYLFTVIDWFTHWPEAIPMADCTAETCAQAFLSGWIARFGVPASITSDRGCQFISELWNDLLHLLGIKPTHTMSYHPQANGMIERMHRQLKASLKARLTTSSWCTQLPIVLLGMCAALKEDLGTSSAEMVYGTTLHLPGDFFDQTPQLTSPGTFVDRLQQYIVQLRPSPVLMVNVPSMYPIIYNLP